MAERKLKDFKKQVIGTFVIDRDLSRRCIVPAALPDDMGPSTSTAAKRKQNLHHPFDWLKRASTRHDENSILGSEIYVARTAEVVRAVLPVRDGVEFFVGARFQKNSSKDVSF